MRKILSALIMGCLLAALTAAPVGAARKKVVKQQWDVIAAPFPGADDHSTPSEECGVEGVTYGIHTYKTPAKGKLDARINGFEGEWDLYVTDSAGRLLGSSVQFMGTSEERVLIKVPAKTELQIYACNFLGGPTAHGELKYVY
ncbi:MAG: hypothetical protein M3285_09565 [Actinomycetota bacterium]|nr:hypothetical protein [Actinomycetota bacterium]